MGRAGGKVLRGKPGASIINHSIYRICIMDLLIINNLAITVLLSTSCIRFLQPITIMDVKSHETATTARTIMFTENPIDKEAELVVDSFSSSSHQYKQR